jgi:lamin tail-like protein
VNLSSSSINLNNWTLQDAHGNVLQQFINAETLNPGQCAVIYGGVYPNGADPNVPTLSTPSLAYLEPANGAVVASSIITGLALSASGGVISLYDDNGILVDRVAYNSSPPPAVNASAPGYPSGVTCSWSRFPGFYSALVPQSYISTNYVTPGAQYDGGSWANPTKVPGSVSVSAITAPNPVNIYFPANTGAASTLWVGNSLTNWFYPVYGVQFSTSSGWFQITNVPSTAQFYYISTQ